MRLTEALGVREKQILVSPLTTPPWYPHKVKAVWISEDRTHVRFKLAGYGEQWLSVDSWQVVPEGARYDAVRDWISAGGTRLTFTREVADVTE